MFGGMSLSASSTNVNSRRRVLLGGNARALAPATYPCFPVPAHPTNPRRTRWCYLAISSPLIVFLLLRNHYCCR